MTRELIANVWADGRGWGPSFGDTTPPAEVAALITDPAVWSEVDPVEAVGADHTQAPDITPPAKAAEPTSVGGGWWELPDGTRVRGREAAETAMAALEA